MPDSALTNRRAALTVFSRPAGLLSHLVRVVMAEKNIANVDLHYIKPGDGNSDLTSLSIDPGNGLPVLIDRELVLTDTRTILEYIDERFPHPPLMPIDPTERAKTRQFIAVIRADLYGHAETILTASAAKAKKSREHLTSALVGVSDSLATANGRGDYFFGDDMTLVDCAMTPLLWRMRELGIKLPKSAERIHEYADRLFARPAFQNSMTDLEKEMGFLG